MRADRGAGAGGAEPDDEDVDLSRVGSRGGPPDFPGGAHAGAPVMIRSGSDPSHPTAASRTIA